MVNSYFNFIETKQLDSRLAKERFPFSRFLFWDADLEKIDLKTNQRYVIERVLTRGFTEDFYMLLKIYSVDEIKAALRHSKELDPKTISFCSMFFNLPKSEMHASSFYR